MIPTLSRLASRMRVGQAHCSLARRSRRDQDPRAHPHVPNDNPFSEAQFKTLKYRPDFPARFGSIQDVWATVTSSSPCTTLSTIILGSAR
jgi:hypothetical protein